MITDLLDDLQDSQDALEQHVIASTLFDKTAELILLDSRRWLGTGKFLPRRLRELDAHRAADLADPLLQGDLSRFCQRVEQELTALGGRVQAGFVR